MGLFQTFKTISLLNKVSKFINNHIDYINSISEKLTKVINLIIDKKEVVLNLLEKAADFLSKFEEKGENKQ